MHQYVELHLHTCYSFLEGASQPDELILRALELGYPALAITDHDGLHGAMEFAQACRAFGIQPITGAEMTLISGEHITLIAESREGYANLSRLITATYMESPRSDPRLDPALLPLHSAGLICLSGCRKSEIAAAIDRGDIAAAEAVAERFRTWFGAENYFLELQHNLVYGDTPRCRALAEIGRRLAIPVVATGNVHYHVRERHRLQDAMVAIKHRSTLDGSHRERRPNSEFFLRTPEEMAERFSEIPDAVANTLVIAERAADFDLTKDLGYQFPAYPVPEGHTEETYLEAICRDAILARYGVKLEGGPHPPAPSPPVVERGGLETGLDGMLPDASVVGAQFIAPAPAGGGVIESLGTADDARNPTDGSPLSLPCRGKGKGDRGSPTRPRRQTDLWGTPSAEVLETRLQDELRLIRKHGLSGFFLLYKDLLDLAAVVAKEVRGDGTARGAFDLPPGRGRGSSVSSLVCYLIGLSHIDPIHFNLRIGRFLNEDLQSVPDIDLDFPRDIRAELIKRTYEHYVRENVALVCTFPTYRVRSAVRDIGKVLGLPAAEIDRLAKRTEGFSRSLLEELTHLPEYQVKLESPVWRQLVELSEEIAGFPRHVSQHVGGMIICSSPVIEMTPVQPAAMEGRFLCQWDKDGVDDAHFIKIDFLALGMLSLVEECLEHIYLQRGVKVDLSRIDFEDDAVYDQICAGDTIGVFQIESRAQGQMLPRSQPRSLEDLAVQVAIIRPGPIVGQAVNPYAERRKARRLDPNAPIEYDHPLLATVLEETLGVILYQDQVLEVAGALAGFTAGQGEMLRRAMSRKRSRNNMAAFWDLFRNGAAAKGVPEETAKLVFEKLLAFSEFGFPKSHAAAFALLAYQSAWLRHYYAPEFYCALFNNQPMGFYPPAVFTNDAKRHGVEVLTPEINRSQAKCSVENGVVRLGLAYVKGIAEETAKAVVAERERGGDFVSLADFARRSDLAREAAENLISVGAFDAFGLVRRELLWQLGLLIRPTTHVDTGRHLAAPAPARRDRTSVSDRPGGMLSGEDPLSPSLSPQQQGEGDQSSPFRTSAVDLGPDAPGVGAQFIAPAPNEPTTGDSPRTADAYSNPTDGSPPLPLRGKVEGERGAPAGPHPPAPSPGRRRGGDEAEFSREDATRLVNPGKQKKIAKPLAQQIPLPLPIVEEDMVRLRQMTPWEKMAANYSILGLSPDSHPLELLRPYLHEGIVSTAHLEVMDDGAPAVIAGMVVTRQRPGTAKGFVFLVLEDEFGAANIVVKPKLYAAERTTVRLEPFVVIEGVLQRREGVTNLIATKIEPLDLAALTAEIAGAEIPDPAPKAASRTDPPPPGHYRGPSRDRRKPAQTPFPEMPFWDGYMEPLTPEHKPTLDELRALAPKAHNFG